ncbi:TonB-dependent receptor domain-containing protein [Pseudovibrio sp. JE062]|uniref:TonB-dependent receptor domain-containing protein n=1 Tax=Pseudovibrio sp. JE062 TaxID=439495 RepID=UPI000186C6A2|nr:TonB-dependent receptor [Pseudovibrio sp. JE062]EEA93846.1 TonB-dependent heme/hemoglobin receptor [Pseudovibrio sp. JE062]
MSNSRYSRAALLASTTLSLALISAAVSAQEAADPESDTSTLLDEIVVSAGTDKVAIDTPQAVTVVTQDAIDEGVVGTASELFGKVPGVNAAGGDSIFGQNFNIRGFGPESTGSGQEGRVLVRVDGATKYYESYRFGGFFGEPELYKRVEVLRGPASSILYGTGLIGGTVSFTTKDASDYLEEGDTAALRLKGTYSSNQEGFSTTAIAAVKAAEDLELLFAGNFRDFQSLVDGNGDEHFLADRGTPSGLAKATYYVGGNRDRVLRASYEHTHFDGETSTTPGGTPFDPSSRTERVVEGITAKVSYEHSDDANPWLDLNFNASYSKQRNSDDEFINADMSYTYYEARLENTLEYNFAGYENYFLHGIDGKFQERRREDLDNTSVNTHPEGDETTIGLFAQNETLFNKNLSLTTAFRGEWKQMKAIGSTLEDSDGDPRAILPDDVNGFSFAASIAPRYEFNNGFAVFASYAYGERQPTIDEEYSWFEHVHQTINPGTVTTIVQGNLENERSHSLEIGFSQRLDDLLSEGDTFSYKLTAYNNYISNIIERGTTVIDIVPGRSGPTDVTIAPWENGSNGRVYGVEIEASYDAQFVFADAGLNLTRSSGVANTHPVADRIAPDELYLTVGGKLPEYDLRFGWDGRFVDAVDRPTSGATRSTKGFAEHDLFVTWKPTEGLFKGLEATARVDNVFDKHYENYLVTSTPAKGRDFKLSLARTLKF